MGDDPLTVGTSSRGPDLIDVHLPKGPPRGFYLGLLRYNPFNHTAQFQFQRAIAGWASASKSASPMTARQSQQPWRASLRRPI
jgi:hypothetical protein